LNKEEGESMTSHELKDSELLRRFLLGELNAVEAEALEERLLREDELFDLAEAIEGDLLAATYSRSELSPVERGRVLRRLAASPRGQARLALARDLTRLARQPEPAEGTLVPFPPRPLAVRIAAMAAGLVLLIGGLWLSRQTAVPEKGRLARQEAPVVRTTPPRTSSPSVPGAQAPHRPEDQTAHVERGPASPATEEPAITPPPTAAAPDQVAEEHTILPAVIQLAYISGTRGAGGSSEVYRISAEAQKIEIQLPISEEDQEEFTSFKVTLTQAKREILSTDDAPVDMIENSPFVILSTQASELQDGRYEIELRGVSPEGDSELIGERQIEIRRHP
jgi:hypothetical protein